MREGGRTWPELGAVCHLDLEPRPARDSEEEGEQRKEGEEEEQEGESRSPSGKEVGTWI